MGDEGVVVSGDVSSIDAAMRAAGACTVLTDLLPSLPAVEPVGPFLFDAGGGVIGAADTGRFLLDIVRPRLQLRNVISIEQHSSRAVLELDGEEEVSFDRVVVAAGAATAGLVASLGIDVPATWPSTSG